MKTKHTLLAVLALALFTVLGAWAAPIVVEDSEGTAFDDWQISALAGAGANLQQNVAVGGETGLRWTINTGLGPDADLIFEDTDFAGNYNTMGARSVSFDFYSNSGGPFQPNQMRMFMMAGGFTWYYDLFSLSSGWNSFHLNFKHYTEVGWMNAWWYNEGGRSAVDFASDLSSVTQIGFELPYFVNLNQEYGLDNFTLDNEYLVPEPGVWLVLAFALVGMAITYRDRLNELAGRLAHPARVA